MQVKVLVHKGKKRSYYADIHKGDDDYFYTFPTLINEEEAEIVISRFSVTIDYLDGFLIRTNLMPFSLFPNKEWYLDKKELKTILTTLEDIGYEGFRVDLDELFDEMLDSQEGILFDDGEDIDDDFDETLDGAF